MCRFILSDDEVTDLVTEEIREHQDIVLVHGYALLSGACNMNASWSKISTPNSFFVRCLSMDEAIYLQRLLF